jgi:hypothetical protein
MIRARSKIRFYGPESLRVVYKLVDISERFGDRFRCAWNTLGWLGHKGASAQNLNRIAPEHSSGPRVSVEWYSRNTTFCRTEGIIRHAMVTRAPLQLHDSYAQRNQNHVNTMLPSRGFFPVHQNLHILGK